jgi:hypothetical protein
VRKRIKGRKKKEQEQKRNEYGMTLRISFDISLRFVSFHFISNRFVGTKNVLLFALFFSIYTVKQIRKITIYTIR